MPVQGLFRMTRYPSGMMHGRYQSMPHGIWTRITPDPYAPRIQAADSLEGEHDMTRKMVVGGLGLALALAVSACGSNLGGGSGDTAEFPGGDPITIYVG